MAGISEILSANFTKAQGLAFIFAISFNMPCVSALTATARETNKLNSDSQLAELIRNSDKVYNIVNGRANGIKLQDLVSAERISNEEERLNEEKEDKKESVYESWFKRN